MKFKDVLKTIAPSIGAAIGGPYGVIAGKLLADAMGEKQPNNEKALQALVEKATSDPELVLKMKDADRAFDLKMEELGIDVFKTEVDDRKNARDMAKLNMWPQIMLTIIFIVGYFWLLFVFLTADTSGISEWQKGIVGTLLGILTAAIPQILAFWFGSSHGSQKKDAQRTS